MGQTHPSELKQIEDAIDKAIYIFKKCRVELGHITMLKGIDDGEGNKEGGG